MHAQKQTLPPNSYPNLQDHSLERIDSRKEAFQNQDQEFLRITMAKERTKMSEVDFQNANWQKAVKNVEQRSNRFHEDVEVDINVEVDYFKIYGPGVYLFFYYLKMLVCLFGLLSMISLAPIIYNALSGTNLTANNLGLNTKLAYLSIGNHNLSEQNQQLNKLMNVIPSLLVLLCCIFFHFYWNNLSGKAIKEVQKEVKLASYNCVVVQSFTEETTEEEIKQYMMQFGVVTQVSSVKNYHERINLSKNIREKLIMYEEMNQRGVSAKDLQAIKIQIKAAHNQLKSYEANDEGQQILKYYVTYDTPKKKERVVAKFAEYNRACICARKPYPPELLLKGAEIKIRACNTEPTGIIWENSHVRWRTRWLRVLLRILLLCFILFLGFWLIFFLDVVSPPLANNSVDTSTITANQIISVTNTTIVSSWCLKQSILIDTSTQIGIICSEYVKDYYYKMATVVGIGFAVAFINLILTYIVVLLAKFQRYKTHSEQSASIILNLFLTYTINTIFIIIALQAKFLNFSAKDFFSSFISSPYLLSNIESIKQYQDLDSGWYNDVGYKLCLTWFIGAFFPNLILPLYYCVREALANNKAKQAVFQKDMEKALERQPFQIESYYASVLMIVFGGLLLSPGMPIILPISFVALAITYFFSKYAFIRHACIPPSLNHQLNENAKIYFFVFIFCYGLVSIWTFGVETIFTQEYTVFQSDFQSSFKAGTLLGILEVFVSRIFTTWYLTFLFAACLIAMVVFCFVQAMCNKCCSTERTEEEYRAPSAMLAASSLNTCEQIETKINIKKIKCQTDSYKMENNPDYSQISQILRIKMIPSAIPPRQ